jgi:hypothetical protein
MSETLKTIPISPSSGSPVAHVRAWKSQEDFAWESTIRLVSGTNPWRPNSLGWPLFEYVLRVNPASTVGEILQIATGYGFGYDDTMRHLRWLYTWGGAYIEIDGRLYNPPPAGSELPVRARKSRKRTVAA